jgi:hypothetical protein
VFSSPRPGGTSACPCLLPLISCLLHVRRTCIIASSQYSPHRDPETDHGQSSRVSKASILLTETRRPTMVSQAVSAKPVFSSPRPGDRPWSVKPSAKAIDYHEHAGRRSFPARVFPLFCSGIQTRSMLKS